MTLNGMAYAEDQATPMPGVLVEIFTGPQNDQRRLATTNTGEDGRFTERIPMPNTGPVTVKYSKIGFFVIATPEERQKLEESINLIPVFVQPDTRKFSSRTLYEILQKRSALSNKSEQFILDVQSLRISGYDPTVLQDLRVLGGIK